MTLRARVQLLRTAYWPAAMLLMMAALTLAFAVGVSGGAAVVATGGAGILMTAAWGPVARRLLQRIVVQHQARVEAALADGDDETYRRLLEETDEYYRVCVPRSEQHRSRLRGSALASEERWSEALAVVGEIDRDKVPHAERRYYLGEALAALGRFDEARAEWHEAVTIAPKSRWGRRARERLDAGAPSAYR